MKRAPFVIILLLLMASYSWASRSIRGSFTINPTNNSSSSFSSSSAILEQPSLGSTTVTCESAYGFLPCTTEVWGQLFLIVVYEYLLSLAQHYVSSGSDLFFKMFGSGIFGASLFQILGTIPQVVILLVNGITGSTSTAEGLTSMGLAMLAGSTVTSLTLIWGFIVAFGSYDISKAQTTPTSSQPSTSEETSTPLIAKSSTSSASSTVKSFSLTGFGVTTDEDTTWTARIMLASMIPFIILQLPQILDSSSATRIVILIALIISIIFWLAYCIYQVFQPWIQDRRLDYILLKFVKDSLLQSLLDPYGNPDESSIKRLFRDIDKNKDGKISQAELEALFLGIKLKEVGLDEQDYVAKVLEQFDISGDAVINEAEFVKGMKGWLQQADNSARNNQKNDKRQKASSSTSAEQQQSQVGQQKKSTSNTNKIWLNYLKAAYLLVLGTAISVLLAQPLMENIQDFAGAINIPSFLISYVVVPWAMSYKQTIAAIKSARQKTENAISLTLSATYGGVFMSGMMSLTMFLLIYYIRDLTWDVSAGMLVVLIVGLVMGFLTSFSTKFPFWTCILAFLLYPISIGLIYVLITYCGWS